MFRAGSTPVRYCQALTPIMLVVAFIQAMPTDLHCRWTCRTASVVQAKARRPRHWAISHLVPCVPAIDRCARFRTLQNQLSRQVVRQGVWQTHPCYCQSSFNDKSPGILEAYQESVVQVRELGTEADKPGSMATTPVSRSYGYCA